MPKYSISLLLLTILFLGACAREKVQIGRENPNLEIEKCIALSKKKRYEEAVECLEIFKSRFPNSAEGQAAGLKIADTHFLQHQYLLAVDAYQTFVKLHPLHPQVEYAYYRAGMSYLAEAPKPIDRDQKYLFKAKEMLQIALRVSYQNTYKDLIVEGLQGINERLAKRLFYIGRFYYRTNEHLAAVPRFEELIQKYPESQLAPKSLYYMAKSNLLLDRTERARQAVQNLIENFPKNHWTKKAQDHFIKKTKKE